MKKWIISLLLCGFVNSTDAQEIETKIFTLDFCPVTHPGARPVPGAVAPIGALVASAIISPLVDAVVDQVVKTISEAAKDRDYPLPSAPKLTRKFYEVTSGGDTRINPGIMCIVVVRGKFDKNQALGPILGKTEFLQRLQTGFLIPDPAAEPSAIPPSFVLRESPEFYFETSLVLGEDKKSFAFRPQAFYVSKFASSNTWFGVNERTYRVTLTYSDIPNNQPFASTVFEFQGVALEEAVMGCVDLPLNGSCAGDKLGGLHGWFATKPSSDSTKEEASKRKQTALMLGVAEPTPEFIQEALPDDMPNTRSTLALYCAELRKENQTRPAGARLDDSGCPPELAKAKRDYISSRMFDQKLLDKVAADAFWGKNCADFDRNGQGPAKCLKERLFKETILGGEFTIEALVMETKPANKIAKFFAPVATSAAPKIKEVLKSELDPVEREKQKQQERKEAADMAKNSRATIFSHSGGIGRRSPHISLQWMSLLAIGE